MSTTTFPLAAEEARDKSGATSFLRRALGDPVWVLPAMAITTLATLVLYLWGLDRNGWANTYYAAAVQAGTQSWKAFFFGSLDAGNFITVDKPPASLWLMELSARIFGLNSWSMLAPEAIAGSLTVLLLFFAVKPTFGPLAGLIAAVAMALTPVAVVMFRYNNPDALLTLVLVASAWAMVRALGSGRLRWLLLSAALVGLAFNTKDLQAYIVVPALVVTYFLFAPGGLGRRLLQLLAAGAVLAVSTGWWLVIVDAIPAAARPYVGGSTNNTVLDLVLGYNGLGRIFGQGRGGGGGATVGGGAGFGGATGLLRLFSTEIGGQIAWLIPLAVVSLAVGLWVYRSRPRTDLARAGYILWGLWFATHFAVFSFASGIFHPYYTVALAPGVAALVGAGLVDMWMLRGRSLVGAVILGAAVAGTGWWGFELLARTPAFMPGLGSLEVALAIVAAVVIVATRLPLLRMVPKRVPQVALAVAVAAMMLGPAAYAAETVTRSSSGAIPSAGPVVANAPGTRFTNGFGGTPSGGPITLPPGARVPAGIADGIRGVGASLGADAIAYLKQHQGSATWLVAVQSANEAASIELSTGKPVLAMGGFSGSDPAMTVDKLAQLVSSGKLRYVLLSGGGPGGGSSSAVQQWIVAHGTAVTIGSTTLYDLAPSGS
ncbi:MAG: glycosyltransferase family 39 protein [Chloroflexi bacterium]|nr:MAG: glycosyltransferase family 39 protein [Chloroflexota bacterium]